MVRERTGSIVKRKPRMKGEKPSWWARVTYIDPVSGKRRDLQRRAENRADARDTMFDLLKEDRPDRRALDRSRAKEFFSTCRSLRRSLLEGRRVEIVTIDVESNETSA